jgi:hypothetical protein
MLLSYLSCYHHFYFHLKTGVNTPRTLYENCSSGSDTNAPERYCPGNCTTILEQKTNLKPVMDFLAAHALHASGVRQLGHPFHQGQLERGVVVKISRPKEDARIHRLPLLPYSQSTPAPKKVKFWTVLRIRIRLIHMFFGLLSLDPDPLVIGMDPDPFKS